MYGLYAYIGAIYINFAAIYSIENLKIYLKINTFCTLIFTNLIQKRIAQE